MYHSGGESYAYLWAGDKWDISVTTSHFLFDLKTALKIMKSINNNKNKRFFLQQKVITQATDQSVVILLCQCQYGSSKGNLGQA